ncbi:MAG: hypothetical protein JO081_09710 [Alphaproteobacteria bacterium]|nr:hypothetical protein [Alphaproteobacteria bacterium]
MPDRLAEHSGDNPLGRPFEELPGKTAADTVAHVEKLADTEVVQQTQLIIGESAQGSSTGSGPLDSPPFALRWSIVMQRKSFLKCSIALNTAVGQLLTREFRPPPGVTSNGKPEPTSS